MKIKIATTTTNPLPFIQTKARFTNICTQKIWTLNNAILGIRIWILCAFCATNFLNFFARNTLIIIIKCVSRQALLNIYIRRVNYIAN